MHEGVFHHEASSWYCLVLIELSNVADRNDTCTCLRHFGCGVDKLFVFIFISKPYLPHT